MSRSKSTGSASAKDSIANLGFEAKLWLAADNRTQSRPLATLRDTLLPKLLSGELRTTGQ